MRIHAFHQLYRQRQAAATRPFLARGAKIDRCDFCQVSKLHCLCQYRPHISSGVAVMLLVSENEVFKPSNTGRLIADTIDETYVFQWSRTQPDEQILALINDSQYLPVVVFPQQYVEQHERLLGRDALKGVTGKKPLLIFLDGSWREARRMFRKSPFLATLPVLSVSPERVSGYMMRKSDNDQHLATAEVASLVLEQCGEMFPAQMLQLWFETFKESYLLSKSRGKVAGDKPALRRYLSLIGGEPE